MEGVVLVNTHIIFHSLSVFSSTKCRGTYYQHLYIKGPLEYKKYSKCKAGMFEVFALDLKATYTVLEDLISQRQYD